jgi:hypothetical protein
MEIRAREITGKWPAWAQRAREDGGHRYVIDGDRLRAEIDSGVPASSAIHAAVTAHFWTRYTRGGTAQVVCLYHPPGESSRVFAGQAGGYGYDKTTAAARGMPVGIVGGDLIVLTDHCGLDTRPDRPVCLAGARDVRLDNLPAPLFAL